MEKSLKKKKPLKTLAENRFSAQPSKIKAISALTLLVLGVAIMPTGFLLSNYIQDRIDEGLVEYKQVPHPHNAEFEEWLNNNYDDASEMYRKFFMWNLTNKDEYLAGATPQYEEVGPFKFRQYTTKYDVEFSESKHSVTYKKYDTFQQVEGENISKVQITNINPGFLGAVMEAGGTAPDLNELLFPMLLDDVRTIFVEELEAVMSETLTEEGITSMLAEAIPGMVEDLLSDLPKSLQDLLNLIMRIMDIDLMEIIGIIVDGLTIILPASLLVDLMSDAMPSALDIMYEEWSNDYFPELDVDLTPLMDYLADNLDSEDLINFLEYLREELGDKPIINFILMITEFFFKIDFIQAILDWIIDVLIDLISGSALQDMLEDFLAGMIRDLGADLVDTEGGPEGKGVDIDGREPYGFTDYPGASPSDLNIAEYEDGGSGISLEKSYTLWDRNDPWSLTGFDYLETNIWYDAMEGDEDSIDFLTDHFDISENQLEMITNWIDVGLATWAKNAGIWTIEDWNAGLVVTRTAEEWLFTAVDTAVYNHQEYYGKDLSLAEVGLFDNCFNEEDAEAAEVPVIKMRTGRDNINKVNRIVEYNGQKKIYLWDEPIEIEGTDGSQFAPGVSEDDKLKIFNLELLRTLELDYKKHEELYEIDLLKYKLSGDTFDENSLYYMDTEGLINLEVLPEYREVPVRVSKPHFLGGDPSLITAVGGMNPDDGAHDTYICVEPISGITMKARQRVQINLEIDTMDIWYEDIDHAVMPIVWREDSGEIPEDLAKEFRDQVYPALELKERAPLLCLGIGAALCVPGVAVSTTQSEKRKRKKIADALPKKKMVIAKKQMPLKITNSQEIERQVAEIRQKLGIDTKEPENIEPNKSKNT
jgi:uncharacterized protein YfkK (UPF0435 family)